MRSTNRERALLQIFFGDEMQVATNKDVCTLLRKDGLLEKLLSREELKNYYREELRQIILTSGRSNKK